MGHVRVVQEARANSVDSIESVWGSESFSQEIVTSSHCDVLNHHDQETQFYLGYYGQKHNKNQFHYCNNKGGQNSMKDGISTELLDRQIEDIWKDIGS